MSALTIGILITAYIVGAIGCAICIRKFEISCNYPEDNTMLIIFWPFPAALLIIIGIPNLFGKSCMWVAKKIVPDKPKKPKLLYKKEDMEEVEKLLKQ